MQAYVVSNGTLPAAVSSSFSSGATHLRSGNRCCSRKKDGFLDNAYFETVGTLLELIPINILYIYYIFILLWLKEAQGKLYGSAFPVFILFSQKPWKVGKAVREQLIQSHPGSFMAVQGFEHRFLQSYLVTIPCWLSWLYSFLWHFSEETWIRLYDQFLCEGLTARGN